MNQVGTAIQRKLTFYVSLANLYKNYLCQLIIHTHINSRQSKLYILSYSVGWNWLMVSDGEKCLVVMSLVKSTKCFFYSCQHDLLIQGRYLVMVFYFISVFLSSNQKLVKFWNYLPSSNSTSPGVYIYQSQLFWN